MICAASPVITQHLIPDLAVLAKTVRSFMPKDQSMLWVAFRWWVLHAEVSVFSNSPLYCISIALWGTPVVLL